MDKVKRRRVYTITKTRKGYDHVYTGTLSDLADIFVLYPVPRTIDSLINKLQARYDSREADCYEKTYFKKEIAV
jgi:hypothetical protein